MDYLLVIYILIQLPVALYLLQPGLMLLLHFIKKWLSPFTSPVNKAPLIKRDFDFAVVITAHKDHRFIPPLVDSLLKQHYTGFHVYVVADACDVSKLEFNDPLVSILKPEQDLNSKIKSINYAVESFIRPHDALVILDSDNLVHPEYVFVLNRYFQQGFRAVQTQMLSKNTASVFSRLDSIGHIYHSFLEREMKMYLGLSAHILGLGVAIDCELYNEIRYADSLGGFDKKLQAFVVKRIPQIAYAREAIVYDEKIDDGPALETQRARWMFTYLHYFNDHWSVLQTGIKRVDFNLIYFGFVLLRPPLLFVVGFALLLGLLGYFITPILSLVWTGLLLTYIVGFILIIFTQSKQKGMGAALLFVPSIMFRQVRALLKIKQAGKSFLKTEHTNIVYIDDILA